jgi:hypothetical protein
MGLPSHYHRTHDTLKRHEKPAYIPRWRGEAKQVAAIIDQGMYGGLKKKYCVPVACGCLLSKAKAASPAPDHEQELTKFRKITNNITNRSRTNPFCASTTHCLGCIVGSLAPLYVRDTRFKLINQNVGGQSANCTSFGVSTSY